MTYEQREEAAEAGAVEAAAGISGTDGDEMTQQERRFSAVCTRATDTPRSYRVMLSTGSSDRELDRIDPKGWSIPAAVPLLYAHDSRALPIGRVVRIATTGTGLRGVMEFPPRGLHPFADTVCDLVESGFLNSVSVGFRPLSYRANADGGVDYFTQELLELSVVPVPAQPDALIDRHVDVAALQKWVGNDPSWAKASAGWRRAVKGVLVGSTLPLDARKAWWSGR